MKFNLSESKVELAVTNTVFIRDIIVPDDANKDRRSRLNKYSTWLIETGTNPFQPDLRAYRDYLLERMSESSVSSHLSTIRSRYAEILRDRKSLFEYVGVGVPFVERKLVVDEIVQRVRDAIHPDEAPVKLINVQDSPDLLHIRLTSEQVQYLMGMPDTSTLIGKRDIAILVTFLGSGLRVGELVNLCVEDLHQTYSGETALHVRRGKGMKERMIPYGDMRDMVLFPIRRWLFDANIHSGPVFRCVYKGGHSVGRKALSTVAVEKILKKYPIDMDGRDVWVTPHDLRRTYARRCFDAGIDPYVIKLNLGHSAINVTERYIGSLDGEQRSPTLIYGSVDDFLSDIEKDLA